jgi:multidrug efflux system membrane fusion protein
MSTTPVRSSLAPADAVRLAVRHSARRAARALVGGLTLALAAACSSKKPPPPAPVPVTVARVQRTAVPYDIDANGAVEPLQTVAVESQVGGTLTRVAFKEGDEVQAGQVLFQIDPRPFEAALAQAQAVLAKDKAQVEFAEQDVQRYAALVKQDYVTAQQFQQVRTNAAALKATLAADSAAVESARLNVQYTTIRAPITGRAGSLLMRQGNLVKANASEPLVVINQIRPILVRFAVPAARLPQIRQYSGNSLRVRARPLGADGVANGTSTGVLSFIDNAVDTTTGTILLKGRFANNDGALWPGQFVNASLQLFVQRDAIVVPSPAVVQGQQGTYVFVVRPDNTANMQPVTVDRAVGDITVIAKGLTPGQEVVTDGQIRLTNGSKVQVKGTAPASDTQRTG